MADVYVPSGQATGVGQTNEKLQEKLIDYIQDAHAMEQSVLSALDSMISTTNDQQIVSVLELHRRQTEQHEQRLQQRLESLGHGASARKQMGTMGATMLKGVGDQLRTDKPGKNARDGYVTEATEIAAYHLLQRLAMRAGDTQTVEIAQLNLRDEEWMRSQIEQHWDRFIDLTLAEAGIQF
jgi:ferritin-like metal-binding protein YciE